MRNPEQCMKWSEKEVVHWLHQINLSEFETNFIKNDINGEYLLQLDYDLLKEMDISTVGDRIRLLLAINELREKVEKSNYKLYSHETSHSFHNYYSNNNYADSNNKNSAINAINTFLKRSISIKDNLSSSNKFHSNNTNHNNKDIIANSPPNSPLMMMEDGELSPSIMSMEIVKQKCVRVYGIEGQSRIVDVHNLNDSKTIMKRILKKFNIDDNNYDRYAIFIVNPESTRSLTNQELLDICKKPGLPEREKFILRKKHHIINHDEFMKLKAKQNNNRINSAFKHPQKDKLTRIFGKRPPSELISSNLSKFFPVPKQVQSTIIENDQKTVTAINTVNKINEDQIEPIVDITDNESNDNTTTALTTATNTTTNNTSMNNTSNSTTTIITNTNNTKYMKGALIGSGSFGSVYLGLNSVTGELMAIKQVELPSPNSASEKRQKSMLKVLQREIDLLKDLDHPNIVRYLGSQVDNEYLSILLEYVPGGSVTGLLNEYGAFEETLIRSFVRQILNGLQYLHNKDIIHRDIKGGNVLVDNKGKIKITDFGISKKVQDGVLSVITNERTSLQGSVFWMAPEVVKQTNYTRKSDIWAVGCLIVEMLTGEHPFPNFTQMQAIFKIGMFVHPEFPDNISKELANFLKLTFIKEYKDRPSSSELLKHNFIVSNE